MDSAACSALVCILDSVAAFDTRNPKDVERIVERVMPRLQHVNSAVVLSAVKVLMRMMDLVGNEDQLKKLVYLYLINYAKAQPDLAIMAVNTFVNDAKDNNPLIRALALRTMGCIRVEKISEYLCGPLSMGLKVLIAGKLQSTS
ncbi:adaptin_N domain-containing protein [Haematococcus lacustris]|uniref:Adaptin_N domain-containing protein n=1 Tax=Haematococcus lacustris TaxID=44745 RepID=A0A699YY22_HAELA|nr:adaptin_N domain-containing protein [Haematococcus lacustris]